MQELISFIIPVYNAKNYIIPCLESLLCQTYPHWEAVLVNDGSTDGSDEILASFAAKDPRFRVHTQENGGVSAARNAGLSLAQGDFIAFIDADDTIKPDYLALLLTLAKEHQADMVCCNFIEVLNGETVHINADKVLRERLVTDKKELLTDFISYREAYGTCVWAKLISAELAKKEAFRPLKFGEDAEFMFRLFLHAPKVYLSLYAGYFYIRNESSATMQHNEKSILRCRYELQMTELLLQTLPEDCQEISGLYKNRYAIALHALATATVLATDHTLYRQERKELLSRIAAILPGISGKIKLYLQLYRRTPWLYRLLLSIKQHL